MGRDRLRISRIAPNAQALACASKQGKEASLESEAWVQAARRRSNASATRYPCPPGVQRTTRPSHHTPVAGHVRTRNRAPGASGASARAASPCALSSISRSRTTTGAARPSHCIASSVPIAGWRSQARRSKRSGAGGSASSLGGSSRDVDRVTTAMSSSLAMRWPRGLARRGSLSGVR